MAASRVPDLADVLAAHQRIAPHLQPTPLYRDPALDALTGARVWVKHENHQPVGAVKVRGGVNLVSQPSADERRRGGIPARPAIMTGRWPTQRRPRARSRKGWLPGPPSNYHPLPGDKQSA